AVVEAGRLRLRPILMTTLTTILGLLPLSFGFGAGAEIQASLARVVIGGLTASTLVTLVFIPVVYINSGKLLDSFQARFMGKMTSDAYEASRIETGLGNA
ncbi:MAG: efflux RND transporter permease subunit, partial [Bacteroidota bacterium]